MQWTVPFPPKFEGEAESGEGVKLRDDDDASLSRRPHHLGDLGLAVRLFLVVGSKSTMYNVPSLTQKNQEKLVIFFETFLLGTLQRGK